MLQSSFDNASQLLDSIADSNSSSSYDMERRSFSSNSNQSAYNNDHCAAFQSSANQTISGISLLSAASTSSSSSASNLPYAEKLPPASRKTQIISFGGASDDSSSAMCQPAGMDATHLPTSVMQNGQPSTGAAKNGPGPSAANLNVSEYTELNDLIDDENGDCLDMSFWENFDNNFTYETESAPKNGIAHSSQASLEAKSGIKRTINQTYDPAQDAAAEKRRKRDSISPTLKKNIRERLKLASTSKEPPATASGVDAVAAAADTRNGDLHSDKKPKAEAAHSNPDVICIDDDDDDTNNNLDATVNRNAEKEDVVLVRISTSPIKANHAYSPKKCEAPQALQTMTLSSEAIVTSADLQAVTKILSESDHRQSGAPPGDPKSQPPSIASVPIDENENYLLDIVSKCLRDKGIRVINSSHGSAVSSAAGGAAANGSCNGGGGGGSASVKPRISSASATGVDKEKENALELQQSEDECAPSPASNNGVTNSLLLPAAQRSSSKMYHVGLPKPIDINRFGMARGRGVCQFKHAIDSTKKTQQQIFHRLQSQQPNGTTYSGSFVNASMIALRNNGSLMRLNNQSLINAGIAAAPTANGVAVAPMAAKEGVPGVVAQAIGKAPLKKPPAAATAVNTSAGIVVLNPADASAAAGGALSGQTHYAILRRPAVKSQNVHFLTTRTAVVPIDTTNSFSVMPVIHRVRTRTTVPAVPKNLQAQTDALLQSLSKCMKTKALASTLLSMSRRASGAQSSLLSPPLTAQPCATAAASAGSHIPHYPSGAKNGGRHQSKAHPLPAVHKTSATTPAAAAAAANSMSSAALKTAKQNGHLSGSGSDGLYVVNSLTSRANIINAKSIPPSYHRSNSTSHRSSASLLIGVNQMQNSSSIDSLILPKIIS